MKVERLKLLDWEEEETGLVIEENEEWLLVKHIPVDFMIDGNKVYKKAFIAERIHSEEEALVERVLRLKGIRR